MSEAVQYAANVENIIWIGMQGPRVLLLQSRRASKGADVASVA